MLTIVTREAAGLVAPQPGISALDPGSLRGISLHHSGAKSNYAQSLSDPKGFMQNLQRYSIQEKGLSDIPYNWVIIPNGSVMEGRGVRYRCAANGTVDGNLRFPAAMFPGDYRTGANTLTAAQVTSFRELRRFVRSVASQATDLKPHSAFKATECPGQNIVNAMPALLQQGSPTPLPPPRPVLRRGSTGTAVRSLQTALNDWGGAKLLVDGIFGPVTEAAVIRFQKAHGLIVDGIVGNQTWGALERYADGDI